MIRYFREPALFLLVMLIAAIIGLDQLTKYIASNLLQYAQPVYVLPVFDWTLLHNHGAAFSFLSDAGGWQRWLFTAISVGVSLAMFVWLLKTPVSMWMLRYSLAFIIGGALGNLIDRVWLGYVVDFISVHWDEHYFPAFNVADSFITMGAGLMIIDMLCNPEHHK